MWSYGREWRRFPSGERWLIFDHIGLVVGDLASGRAFLAPALGVRRWTAVFDDTVNGVRLQFGADATGVCYELLEPLGEASPVRRALTTGRAILNHVAYRIGDLDTAAEALMLQDCVATGEPKPAIAYGGRRIQFFMTPLNMIVELIEAPDHQHAYDWMDDQTLQTETTAA
jgi:methylmalonyl-CoA/ethylmalonyl-CoA epimerase